LDQLPSVTVAPFARVVTDLVAALPADGRLRFRADGGSMRPTIRSGEMITVGGVDPRTIAIGDILLVRVADRVLAHRVIVRAGRADDLWILLQGDAMSAADAPVSAADIIGRVLAVERRGRTIALYGRAARMRHTLRAALSRARARVMLVSPHVSAGQGA